MATKTLIANRCRHDHNSCMSNVTRILSQIDAGNPKAAEQLLPLVYDELRKLAADRLAHEKPGQTLQATALVHEAYLRLVRSEEPGAGDQEPAVSQGSAGASPSLAPSPQSLAPSFHSRGHFFAAAALAMRRILVENARRKLALKQGGQLQRQDVELDCLAQPDQADDVLALDEALARLSEQHPTVARLVELRYFAGLTLDEAAAALELSARTAYRYWAYAKAWLHHEIREKD